jgi:predicted enzyme related to lactoylglutathione lyase
LATNTPPQSDAGTAIRRAAGGAKILYPIVFLPTSDMRLTREFYEKTLELPVALDQKACTIFSIGKYGYWGFCNKPQEMIVNPEKVCLTLVVEDHEQVDEWHRYLVARNVKAKRRPMYTPDYKIYNAFYADPMGYTIEIQAFDADARPAGQQQF